MRRLDWSDSTTYATEEETYDVVVAADMLYLEEHVEDLANAVDATPGVDGRYRGVRRAETRIDGAVRRRVESERDDGDDDADDVRERGDADDGGGTRT